MDAPVNPQVLADLTGEDTEQCKQLLVKFRDASIPIIKELTVASAEIRFDDVTSQAHKLKSSARTVGAGVLADLCISIEHAGKEKIEDNLSALASKLTDEFDRVKRYIINWHDACSCGWLG